MHSPSEDCDVLFMCQLGKGPAQKSGTYSIDDVKNMLGTDTCLITRAVNLKSNRVLGSIRGLLSPQHIRNYINKRKNEKSFDKTTLTLLHMSDYVIFQSNWQKDMFSRFSYAGSTHCVIHNGAPVCFTPSANIVPLKGKLRLLSSSISKGVRKRHKLIADISNFKDVEMHYVGNWPEYIDKANVHLHGIITHDELAELWKTMHYCFHPSVNDPCPNAVCEALASGVPVIYNPKPGGTIELASSSGIALNERNLKATVQEAGSRYMENVQKARESSGYYSISRALNEYVNAICSHSVR